MNKLVTYQVLTVSAVPVFLVNEYPTLSRLWKTNEFLHVMIALAIGPAKQPVSSGFIEI